MPSIGCHDDVIKWKHFPRYWPFVRGIQRSPMNSPHKGQWRGGVMFSLICVFINSWVNNREAGDLRRHRAHYDVTVTYGSDGNEVKTRLALLWFRNIYVIMVLSVLHIISYFISQIYYQNFDLQSHILVIHHLMFIVRYFWIMGIYGI